MKEKRIVITGMGTVNPCGNTIKDYWYNLIHGKSGISKISKYDTTNWKCKIGGEVKNFISTDYDISKKDAEKKLDLAVQFAMAASTMAIQDSKIILSANYNPRVGVIFGVGIGGFASLESTISDMVKTEDVTKRGAAVSPYTIPKIMPNASAAMIAIQHNLHGLSYTVNSACASSLHAMITAAVMISNNLADVMVTGGTDNLITEASYAGFSNMQALTSKHNDSPETASQPFDAERSGFVMGEGAGAIVLESYDHAKARGAKILAEIIGFGMTSDATNIVAPGQELVTAIKNALTMAGIKAKHVDYINAHGTSTGLNDKMETRAIKMAFGNQAYSIPISSTKSMTGHLLGGAGAIEIIASVLTMQNGIIHPTINLTTSDTDCDLDYVPNKARTKTVDIVLKTGLGFGGHNACLLLKKV